ncbi:MAG: hypothetical protein HY080_07300 [Gammaproteobacteria bacterium]|nr:hypothetical protein [Gammaproteobacteria bacterium]
MTTVRTFGLMMAISISVIPFVAKANDIFLSANPSSWRLQNYIPGTVVAWFMGSPCVNGGLSLPANSNTDDKNRSYATVMAAKLSNRNMYVYYDSATTPGNCVINSFGLDP